MMLIEVVNTTRNRFDVDILLNGISFFRADNIEEASRIYEAALQNLDDDINEVADLTREDEYHDFYWWLTYDGYRVDGIGLFVLEYLLLEILKAHLGGEEVVMKSKVSLNKSFYDFCAVKGVRILRGQVLKDNIRHHIRNSLGPLKILFSYASHLRLPEDKASEQPQSSDLLFSQLYEKNYKRWGRYATDWNSGNDHAYFFGMKEATLRCTDRGTQHGIKVFAPSGFYKAWRASRKFQSRKRSYKKQFQHSFFGFKLLRQSFFQSFAVFLRYYSLLELFRKSQCKRVHVMSSFGDPFHGTVLKAALDAGKMAYLYLCRPYISRTRSEDRVIAADKKYGFLSGNDARVVVRDEISRKYLEDMEVQSELPQSHTKNGHNEQVHCSRGLLLLFAHSGYNDTLLNLVDVALRERKNRDLKIFYREHPVVPLDERQESVLKALSPNLENLNDYDWQQLTFNEVLTFSANTTAGIEAMKRGAVLMWLPFLNHQYLQFTAYFKLGQVAHSREDAVNKINNFLDKHVE